MPKLKTPNFIQERIDLKNESILATVRVLGNQGLEDGREVTILSTIGLVKGTVQSEFGLEEEGNEVIKQNDAIMKERNEYLADVIEDDESPLVINNYALLTLTDVEIIPFNPCSGSSFKMDVLNLFSDQIVGYTYGKLDQSASSTEK
jgi:hypothetical protein